MRRTLMALVALAYAFSFGCQQSTQPLTETDAPGAACGLLEEHTMNIDLVSQEATNWCWAASGQMVMSHYNRHVRQCDQVNDRYGLTKCCEEWYSSDCDRTGWPQFERYNFAYQKTSSQALGWEQLKEQVACKNNPVAFAWKWPGGSGHMMVIKGFKTVDGVHFLWVNDPDPYQQYGFISYDDYVEGNDHTHWDDYYDFRYQGGS